MVSGIGADMSLDTIKTQLNTNFHAITGVVEAYEDQPNLNPAAADCPAVVWARRDPFLTWSSPFCGTIRYTWHFDVLFLYKPFALGTQAEIDAALEPFPARFVAKFVGALTLSGNTIASVGIANQVHVGVVPYNAGQYWGFTFEMDVSEDVNTTMAA